MTGHPDPGFPPDPGGFEETLREREAFIRSIGDNLPDGMIYQLVREPDGTRRFTYLSEAVRRLHGCSPEEAMADAGRVYGTILEEDRARVAVEEEAANAALSVFRTEVRRIDPEGRIRWSAFASSPRRLADGTTCWDGVEIDVTERKRVEEALRLSEENYRTVSRMTSEYVFRLDVAPDGSAEMTMVTDGLHRATGRSIDDVRNLPQWERLVHPEDRERLLELLRRLVAEGGRGEFEGRFPRGDGAYRCVHVLVEAVRDGEDRRTTAIVGAVADVTARRKAERESQALQDRLVSLNAELEAALRLKDEFLSSMSHELRTPLNAILGFLQAVRGDVYGATNERLLRSAGLAEDAARHLLDLIGDILDLSKVQAGRLGLEMGPVPVRALCESCLHMVEKLAEKKRIRLALEQDPGVPTIVGDGRRIKQILVNLLSNAVKFTPEGGNVRLAVAGDPVAKTVRLSVTDDGIGIAEEALPRLFKPFTQVESGLSRLHAGSGLGLSLVLGLTTLHGGGVDVSSRPGEGSRFTVTLPWRRPEGNGEARREREPEPGPATADAPRGASAAPLSDRRGLLVVEDNEANAVVLSEYLSHRGYDVTVARNGFEALRLSQEAPPGLILMDIQMPGMDGLETIRRLREDERLAQVPILAVTALAMPGDRERCASAGASGYLTKPLDLEGLARTVEDLLHPAVPAP
ncbi:MAG: response regulator [Thermoanaerobaculia bacterium]|nr:response regulator [Thermoanaerobaculia bacterium]